MSKNLQESTLENQVVTKIRTFRKQIEQMRGTQPLLVVPQLSADPASPVEGQLWENTTTHLLKIYINGVKQTITIP
jgi:hypothetical protein